MPTPHRYWLSASLLGLWGCGEGVRPADATACDPVLDTGCGAGLHCRLVMGGETRCLPATQRIAQPGCSVGSCAPGQACVIIEGALGCHPVCRVADDDGCPSDRRCAYRLDEAAAYGVCAPRCEIGADDCATGTTCAPTADFDHPICVATGDGGLDAPCGPERRCGVDLACLVDEDGTRCRALCRPAPEPDTCPVGACTGLIRNVPSVGFCVGETP